MLVVCSVAGLLALGLFLLQREWDDFMRYPTVMMNDAVFLMVYKISSNERRGSVDLHVPHNLYSIAY